MASEIIAKIKSLLGFRKPLAPPKPDEKSVFFLTYGDLLVGILSAEDGHWKFEYSMEFKAQDILRPILEMPDVTKIYESNELWQFFETRIPSLEQEEIKKVMEAEDISEDDSVELLRRFGKRTITNPFNLELQSLDNVKHRSREPALS